MADNGISGFRSKFGGFHKDDVLQYINALQAEHSQEIAAWQQQAEAQRVAYDKALTDANAALAEQFNALQTERAEQEQLQQLLTEQYEVNRVLRDEVSKAAAAQKAGVDLKAHIAALQQQNAALQQQNAALQQQMAAIKTQQAEQTARREQELQKELAELKAENSRYRELVQDVGSFVVEVRAMGQRYLEEVNQRCRLPLNTLQQAIGSLKAAEAELAAADQTLSDQQSGAGRRLDELARELEESANAAEAPAPAAAPAPAHFF